MRRIDARTAPGGRWPSTDQAGYTAMRRYVAAWPDRVWAVEGSNGAGRPLAQRLLEAGERVVDVPARLSARVRLFDTGHNRKTDARDAHSIAVVAVRTKTLRVLRVDAELEALRMLADRREAIFTVGAKGYLSASPDGPNALRRVVAEGVRCPAKFGSPDPPRPDNQKLYLVTREWCARPLPLDRWASISERSLSESGTPAAAPASA